MVICLERGADLHMAQLMPLPLTVSCFSKIQIGFALLVPAHFGSPGKGPLNGCVCVCVQLMAMQFASPITEFNLCVSVTEVIHNDRMNVHCAIVCVLDRNGSIQCGGKCRYVAILLIILPVKFLSSALSGSISSTVSLLYFLKFYLLCKLILLFWAWICHCKQSGNRSAYKMMYLVSVCLQFRTNLLM